MKRTRKKSVLTTRLLRHFYAEDPHPDLARKREICKEIETQCNESLSVKDVTTHFNDKMYREAKKNVAKSASRDKSERELFLLKNLWKKSDGKMLGRSHHCIIEILKKTALTYDEISQWIGQQRYKIKRKKKDDISDIKFVMPYVLEDLFSIQTLDR
jgi:hypothetical protein